MEHAPLHHSISVAPDSGIAYWVSSEDGVQLRIGVWKPEQSSRGTVLFFPGRGDYIELYGHPITSLLEARLHTIGDRVAGARTFWANSQEP